MFNVNLDKLKQKAKEFDYIRFTLPDLNGVGKGITVTGRYVDKYLEEGLGCYIGKINTLLCV